jgi:AraC-like DNA-binding protein
MAMHRFQIGHKMVHAGQANKSERVVVEYSGPRALDGLCRKLCTETALVSTNYVVSQGKSATAYHLHPDILHITYFVKGSGECRRGTDRELLRPGLIHVIYPNEPHAFIPDRETPYCAYFVKVRFSGTLPQRFPRLIRPGRRKRKLENLFRSMAEQHASAKHTATRNLRATSMLLQLFAELIELCGPAAGKSGAKFPRSTSQPVARLLVDLQTPPFHFPGLDRMARTAHMSRKAFSQYFRRTTGMSPLQFALEAKLSHAKILVDARESTVKEMADACGYSSIQNFIRAYKARYGRSPGGRASSG